MNAITEIRLRLRANGYEPIPVKGKSPHIRGWQQLGGATPEQIESWERDYPDHTNTGILTRFTPCLDLDITDEILANAVVEFVRGWCGKSGGVMLRRVGQAPKCAIFFRTIVPFKKISMPLVGPDGKQHKIEMLGDGQQAVVHGIHPGTGRPYEWPDGQDLCDVAAEHLGQPPKRFSGNGRGH